MLPRLVKLCPSEPGHSTIEDVADEAVEDELAVVLCEMITTEGKEEEGGCDVLVEELDLDVVVEDNTGEVVLELLELLELLEVLVFDVELMVVVGTSVEETTIVATTLVLEVTDEERDAVVELVVETIVDEVLTSEQSVETQYP